MLDNLPAIRRLALGLLLLAGCTDNQSGPDGRQTTAADTAGRETWSVYLLDGQRVGYGHTTIRRDVESGREVVRTGHFSRLTLRRGGDAAEQAVSGSSVETARGELIRFESEMRMGPGAIRSVGRVNGDKLDIETFGPQAAEPARTSLPWSPDIRGPFAVEQELRSRPMRPGERRAFKCLQIGFNQSAEVELAAGDYESVELPDGRRKLLRVDSVIRFPDGQEVKEAMWCDPSGEALKTESKIGGAMKLEAFRTSKDEAMKTSETPDMDLLPAMLVKVERPLPNPHRTERVRYRVRLERGDPAKAFPAGPTQQVESIGPHEAEITVYAVRPEKGGGNPDAPPDKPTDDDLRPNNFIQSDDPLIRANAEKAAGGETDPWRVATALERFVNREVEEKNYTQAFATAAEVARSREGDCTEHAVYLAALARARGIPARVAVGLLYVEEARAFGYHAWTEVYVKDRWIPIDGTLALGGVGAAHLKIAAGNLQGSSIYNALLPVLKLIGGLRIEILDARATE